MPHCAMARQASSRKSTCSILRTSSPSTSWTARAPRRAAGRSQAGAAQTQALRPIRRGECRCTDHRLTLQRRWRHALYRDILPALGEHGLKINRARFSGQGAALLREERDRPASRSRYLAEVETRCALPRSRRRAIENSARAAELLAARAMLAAAGKDAVILDRSSRRKTPSSMCVPGSSSRTGRRRRELTRATSSGQVREREIRTGSTRFPFRGLKCESRAAGFEDHGRSSGGACARTCRLLPSPQVYFPSARERGSDAHVRGRGRSVPHQPPLPSAVERHAGERSRPRSFGDALRLRPGPARGHLRQGRQLGRIHRTSKI